MEPNDYLLTIKTEIVANSVISGWEVVREEIQDSDGIYRYRLTLVDGSLLEVFERFEAMGKGVKVNKYSFHWQHADGQLHRRWDNAAHHKELPDFPHHIHVMTEDGTTSIKSVPQPSLAEILKIISADIMNRGQARQ